MNRHLRFLTVAAALTTAVLGTAASAAADDLRDVDDMTVAEATQVAGGLELNLCNEPSDALGPGVVGRVLDKLSLFDQCSQVTGAPDEKIRDVKKQMGMPNAHLAYCQRSPSNAAGGLVNLGLPCAPAQ